MATKSNTSTKLTLKVLEKNTETGAEKIYQRAINNIDPALNDDVLYGLGLVMAGLQKHELISISRTDSAILSE